ncbi:MAG: hypothetical protein LQ348_004955 [Seirophora lacunosa]|nr:MAG: hypothetical protein LQ348_004955 [Seirophora lacunosa]
MQQREHRNGALVRRCGTEYAYRFEPYRHRSNIRAITNPSSPAARSASHLTFLRDRNYYFDPPFKAVPHHHFNHAYVQKNGTSDLANSAAASCVEVPAPSAELSARQSAGILAGRSNQQIYVHPARRQRISLAAQNQNAAQIETDTAVPRDLVRFSRRESPLPTQPSDSHAKPDKAGRASIEVVSEDLSATRNYLESAHWSDEEGINRLRADHDHLLKYYHALVTSNGGKSATSKRQVVAHCRDMARSGFLKKLQTKQELETVLTFINHVRRNATDADKQKLSGLRSKVREKHKELNESYGSLLGTTHTKSNSQESENWMYPERKQGTAYEVQGSAESRGDVFLDKLGQELESHGVKESMATTILDIIKLTRKIANIEERIGSGERSGGLEGLGFAVVHTAEELLTVTKTLVGTAAGLVRPINTKAGIQEAREIPDLRIADTQGSFELPDSGFGDSSGTAGKPPLQEEEAGFPHYPASDSDDGEISDMQLP